MILFITTVWDSLDCLTNTTGVIYVCKVPLWTWLSSRLNTDFSNVYRGAVGFRLEQ